MGGVEAHSMGMAVRCVPLAELDVETAKLCDELAANSAGALAAYKVLYDNPEVLAALQREVDSSFPLTDSKQRLAGFE